MSIRQLYYTVNSPYARIVRAAARKSGLAESIEEIVVVTRDPGTPYFGVTPLARVPVLVDGAQKLADTRDICAHFDVLTGNRRWFPEEDSDSRYLRHIVTGFLDGVAVWLRENARPDGQRSDPVMRYEELRAERALAWIAQHWRPGSEINYVDLVLACAIEIGIDRKMGIKWPETAPTLVEWVHVTCNNPDMRATRAQPL